jgi:UDP-2-acetamido-3-amino-2,3-dideoxy-glucuronate N-acetyltransferase
LEWIRTRSRPETDGEEGLNVLRILQASQQSLNENGKVIELGKAPPAPSPHKPRPFVHGTSVVDEDVVIGEGTKIWHFSHVLSGSRIGGRCNIGQNVVIGPDVTIGDGCKIQNNVSVYKGVTLEDEVFCGPSMVFTNVYNPRASVSRMDEVRPTLVKKGATLGANATIVCGNTIGRYAFVGAGAVVTGDVPDHALVVGNPARQVGWVCECGGRIREDSGACSECGRELEAAPSDRAEPC